MTSSAPDFNPTFSYDSEGDSHEVWFLDASTFANQLRAVDQEGCAGVLIRPVGGKKTPTSGQYLTITRTIGRDSSSISKRSSQKVSSLKLGNGDFLTADLASEAGRRKLWVDSDGYVCETYRSFARPKPRRPYASVDGKTLLDQAQNHFANTIWLYEPADSSNSLWKKTEYG